ncbi:MAG: hypothetical protein ACOCWQ_03250, partial [Nanoarchaeota archaeon]
MLQGADASKYLNETLATCTGEQGRFLVAQDEDEVVAAMVLRRRQITPDGRHSVWRYNHVAVRT